MDYQSMFRVRAVQYMGTIISKFVLLQSVISRTVCGCKRKFEGQKTILDVCTPARATSNCMFVLMQLFSSSNTRIDAVTAYFMKRFK